MQFEASEDLLRRGPLGQLLAGGGGERDLPVVGEPGGPPAGGPPGGEADRPVEAAAGPDAAREGLLRGVQGPGRALPGGREPGQGAGGRAERGRDGRRGLDLLGRPAPHEPVRRDVRSSSTRGASVRLEYLHPTRVVESVSRARGRARPDLVPAQVARADGHPLARGGDGPGRPPVAPVRRAGRAFASASSTARRSSGSTPTCRSAGRSTGSSAITTSRSGSAWNSTTSRTSSGPSRSRPAWRSSPRRPWRARSRRGRSSRSGSTARTPASPDPPAGDHPPAAPSNSA